MLIHHSMNRTQIYLDESQTARLDELAATEGSSRSMIIRHAVDVYLSQAKRDAAAWQEQWQQAVQKSAGLAPSLREGAELVEDVRRVDAERLSRFEN